MKTSDAANASGDWGYNALDCVGTREVFDTLIGRLSPGKALIYGFERALQGPALAMMRRGVLVDTVLRAKVVKELEKELDQDERGVGGLPQVSDIWDATELVTGVCSKAEKPKGHHKWPRGVEDSPDRRCERCDTPRVIRSPFNAGSFTQCYHLFYDLYKCQKMHNKTGGVTTDDEALSRLGRRYPKLLPVTEAIQAVRDKKKQLGFLKGRLTADDRYRQSVNVGAAWTGRFSSSKNPFGEGGNLQNISERHRNIFIADPGFDLCYADLKQAESLLVAYLAGDDGYIEAHRSGDTHTYVCRLLWPDMPWTGDLKKDKAIAKTLPEWDPVAGHDWRFQAKRIQHGSNYGLTPYGIAIIGHIPVKEASKAQARFFDAFPGIRAWQRATAKEVASSATLRNPLGREVELFGRPWDGHTYKQGLAFRPQSGVADLLDLALFRVWQECDPALIQCLAQVHDAILSQFRRGSRDEAVARLRELMSIPCPVRGIDGVERTMVIPVEIAVGRNWGHRSEHNPNGIEEIPE